MDHHERSTYVGSAVLRREDERLLTGTAQFIDDIDEPVGTVHLAFVRSPYPHARILAINSEAARAIPGVLAVFTGGDIAAHTEPAQTPTRQGAPFLRRPFMATDVVRFVGETVAVVVAENPYIAEDALQLVEVDYDELPAVLDVEQASAEDAPRVHDYLPDNIVFHVTRDDEEAQAAFRDAPHVLGDVFSSGRVSAVAMETRGFLSRYDKGKQVIEHYASAQFPHKMRWEIAQALRLPEKNVIVTPPHVGGSFGMKGPTHSEDIVGAVVAKLTGRPVKWICDRQEDLTLMHGRDFHFEVTIACDDEGILQAVRLRARVDIGAYPLWIATAGLDAGGAAHHMMGPYRVKHYLYEATSLVTNKAPTTSYRGVAAPVNVLAIETLLQRMALKLGIDPIEIRRKNLITPADLPYRNAVNVVHDTASHIECLDRALELVGYEEFKRTKSGRLGPDGKYRGIGVATITDHTGQGTSIARSRGQSSRWPGYDGAVVRMEPDGNVIAYGSFASQGQGHQTVFSQIIADQLGIPIESVTVSAGDTTTMPFGTGAGASRGAVAGGGAFKRAGGTVAAKLRRIAASILNCEPDDVVLKDGKAGTLNGNQFVDYTELAATAYMIGPGILPEGETIGLEATEFFDPPTSSYSNATHAVCVAVDARTGRAEIERFVIIHDCGEMLNPMIVEGQVIGAAIQGIGSVLTEHVRFSDNGQPLATTLLDYAIPTFLDVPTIELGHITTASTTSPLGLKGAGEGGIVGAVPAITLALSDALSSFDAYFNTVPITPEKLRMIMSRPETKAA